MGRFRLAHTTILTRITGLGKNIVTLLDIFGLGQLPRSAAAPDEVFAGKQEFEMSPQV